MHQFVVQVPSSDWIYQQRQGQVKVKVNITFTKAVVKVKVLHQPFGKGGEGGKDKGGEGWG